MKRKKTLIGAALFAVLIGGTLLAGGSRTQFILGGAFVNLGYRMQDHLADFDLQHHDLSPAQVWDAFQGQNAMAASVRETFPRTSRHPLVALVACMDARLDTNEIAGDTRRYYYVIRLAGSVLAEKEEEMLELAVANGVKVVVFTTHTDCAAEKIAADPAKRGGFPHLTKAIGERKARFDEFMARPAIREKIAKGELLVKWMDVQTETERLQPRAEVSAAR